MQLQSRYTLRNAADQCGKKSNDIKRAGGIRRFIDDNNAVSKWTMRRTNQAYSLNFLLKMYNIKQLYDEYKHTRPLQIL